MKITKKQVNAVIKQAVFSPLHDKQMQIIADVGGIDYYIRRTQEILSGITANDTGISYALYHNQLIMAIRLLTLAKINLP